MVRTPSGEPAERVPSRAPGAAPAATEEKLFFRPGLGHYEGPLKNGMRHGSGTQTWEFGARMGSRYAGEWKDDSAHGQGTLTVSPDGLVAEGGWRAGRLHGWSSSVLLAGGECFYGVFRNGLPDGPDCEWTRPSRKQRFKAKYVRGRPVHGVLEDNSTLEPAVSEWRAGADKSWDWETIVGLEMLAPTPEDVQGALNGTEWVERRTEELSALWKADHAMVLEFARRYQWEPEQEGMAFTAACLGELAAKMWERTPSAHMFASTRTLGKIRARARAVARATSEESDELFMESVVHANEHCTLAGNKSFHAQKCTATVKSLNQAQHPHFFRELLVGRAEQVEGANAGLLLDLTSVPYKHGDMEYVAKIPFGNSSKISKTSHSEGFPRKYVDRLCGHTLRRIHPRVDVSIGNLLGNEDEDISEKLIQYRMHGASPTRGCQRSVSGGSSHDLSGTCTHIAAYSGKSDFESIRVASESLSQAQYEIGPKVLDAEGKEDPERQRSMSLRLPTASPMDWPSSKNPTHSEKLATGSDMQPKYSMRGGMLLPGFQRKPTMIPEECEVYRTSVIGHVRHYLMHDTRNNNSEMSLSALGEIGYHGSAKDSERPQVLWSDLNRAFGYERACFKAVHECWSHELEELPYSTGITRLPPAKPRTLHDADELIHALGLREDNFEILNRVTALNVSGHRLIALPDRLVMLKNLCSLDASANRLVALPVHLATLSSLTYLDVSENSALFSDIPESVVRLRHLRDLLLANTGLVRISKSISQLRDLALFDVSRNCITSLPRKELAAMPKLVSMACHGNPRVAQRVCGIPEEVARGRGTTTRVRDGDRHANIPLSDTWNWTPDGVLGYLRHRPHAFVTVRKMDGQQTNGWTRSSTAVVLEAYGAGDRVTFLIDELVRLIIFQRRDPFPAAPRGPQLAYAPVADAVEDVGKKRKGKKGGKKTKTKNGEQRQAPLIDKYYVAGRIHDIWLQFQADYAHLTKCKPGQEAVFFKHLVAAMNKTSLLSTVVADLQRLLKVFKKRFAKDGFPFPPSYLEEGRPVDHFPGKGASQEGANSDDSSALARSSHKIPDPGL